MFTHQIWQQEIAEGLKKEVTPLPHILSPSSFHILSSILLWPLIIYILSGKKAPQQSLTELKYLSPSFLPDPEYQLFSDWLSKWFHQPQTPNLYSLKSFRLWLKNELEHTPSLALVIKQLATELKIGQLITTVYGSENEASFTELLNIIPKQPTISAVTVQSQAIYVENSSVAGHVNSGNMTLNYHTHIYSEEQSFEDKLGVFLKWLCQTHNALPLASWSDLGVYPNVQLENIYMELDVFDKPQKTELLWGIPPAYKPIRDVLKERSRLLLLGDPGSGKSAFLKILMIRHAQALQEKKPNSSIPLFVSLRQIVALLNEQELENLSVSDKRQFYCNLVYQQLGKQWVASGVETNPQALLPISKMTRPLLFLFDGLDEVPHTYINLVQELIQAIAQLHTQAQIIVTCRIRSYTPALTLPNFDCYTIAPLTPEKITAFSSAWYESQAENDYHALAEARKKANDLAHAARQLHDLAQTPLLLTTMALIHQHNTELPKQKVMLYQKAVELLLYFWQRDKGVIVSTSLANLLKDHNKIIIIMQCIAYELHIQQSQNKGSRLNRSSLLDLLEKLLKNMNLSQEFLDYIDQQSGLLLGYGGEPHRPQEYDFPHRIFQEYLVGCYLNAQKQPLPRVYRQHLYKGSYWREAIYLGLETLYFNEQLEVVLDIAYDLSRTDLSENDHQIRTILCSGFIAQLIGISTIKHDKEVNDGGGVYLDKIRQLLLTTLRDYSHIISLPEKRDLGIYLSRLGDIRDSVTNIHQANFCWVPAGDFWMGQGEKSLCLVKNLDYGYWLGQFPVTYAQYQQFIEADGYAKEEFWAEAITDGIWIEHFIYGETGKKRNKPNYMGEGNQPVTGLTWYEAQAFTRWLTQYWHNQNILPAQYQIVLPSEEEWEKGCRGGNNYLEKPIVRAISDLGKTISEKMIEGAENKRIYPWGNEFSEQCTAITEPSGQIFAVGSFPKGTTVYGAEDMLGNIWEWTRSPNPLSSSFTYPKVLKGGGGRHLLHHVSCSMRSNNPVSYDGAYHGFRLAIIPTHVWL